MSDPHGFRRRVLLAVTGLSPQIVTETLYALAVQQQPAFMPTEIHLITTQEGANRARLSLLSESPGGFHSLCKDYHLPEIAFPESNIHVLTGADGEPLEDIRTPEENLRAADFITEIVRQLTVDSESAVHVSMAGGRKTMGFFVGYALTLFGRPQDRLSHVLVSPPFESSYQFFYPTPYPKVIEVGANKLADTSTAEVTLAEIPFVSLRHGLPEELQEGRASYNETVEAARLTLGAPSLVIDVRNQQVTASGKQFHLAPAQLAMLLVFARRILNGEKALCAPSKEYKDSLEVAWAERYLAELHRIVGLLGDTDVAERTLTKGMDGDYFSTTLSRLHKSFEKNLGKTAIHYRIGDGGCRPRQYSLSLWPTQITLIE